MERTYARMEKTKPRHLVLSLPYRLHPQIPEEVDIWKASQRDRRDFPRVMPQYGVAQAVGRLKGKSAILIHRRYLGKGKNLTGYHFWARGYCVSTVGLDEETVRQYIRDQEAHEQQLEQHVLPVK